MTDGAVPATGFPISASAPGKCIVFGEHAVVHGGPELLFALDLRTQVVLRSGPATSLNGSTEDAERNRYLGAALRELPVPDGALELTAVSRIPRASGLGSSSAFVAAVAAGLAARRGGADRPELARHAFGIERAAQGVGSPGDTSAAVAGGFLTINAPRGALLWEVGEGAERWSVRRVEDPGWNWVVAYSRVPHDTAVAVRAVTGRLRAPDGPTLLWRFAAVAESGIAAVQAEDREATGRALRENQALLREVGVSTPRLEALLEVARPTSVGEKLTGAGCGGSVLVLPAPGREIATAQRLASAGAEAFVVRPSADGAHLL